jgi:hypothetical protein
VFCILQEAIGILTEMLNRCVDDYIKLMSQLPSFNTDVDVELERYSHAMENFAQEATLWYWSGVPATVCLRVASKAKWWRALRYDKARRTLSG